LGRTRRARPSRKRAHHHRLGPAVQAAHLQDGSRQRPPAQPSKRTIIGSNNDSFGPGHGRGSSNRWRSAGNVAERLAETASGSPS
jgi:hypothetical protein